MDSEKLFTEEMNHHDGEVTGMAAWEEPDAEEETAEEENLLIKLKKPYLFDGKEYTEIDLSRLEDMTADDMLWVEKQYDRSNPGISVMPEVKLRYALLMAARATQMPIEFFELLPQREAMKIKTRVRGFLFGSD